MRDLTLFELDTPFCEHVYGEPPCQATTEGENPTGAIKCFNTRATCQDLANFSPETVTLRFAMKAQSYTPIGFDAIPFMTSVKYEPGRISLGESLGKRSQVTLVFDDHPWSDTGIGYDKYVAERPYDAFGQGSYWGKFRARHLSVRGMGARLLTGAFGDALEDMETAHFVADEFNGPTPKRGFSLVARDILKLLDGDRVMVPPFSNGYLAEAIDNNDTEFDLSPPGIGDEEYPEAGEASIGGKERVSFTRDGDTITLTARGKSNTQAIAHDEEDRFQIARVYTSQKVPDIFADILENDAGVPASQIPLADWLEENDNFLAQLYSADIAHPVPARQLFDELIEQAGLAVWPDEIDQEIKFQVLRGIATDAEVFDESNIDADSLDWVEQPEQRVSRVLVYYGLINPLERLDDPHNYRSSALTIDADAEALHGGVALRVIFARWIPEAGRPVALKLGSILKSRFRTPPRRFTFRTRRGASIVPQRGRGYRLRANGLQDATGLGAGAPIQATRARRRGGVWEVEAEEMLYVAPPDLGIRFVTVETSQNNLNLRDYYDQIYGEPDPETPIVFTIAEPVSIGSTSTSLYAIEMGEWPEGVVPVVRIKGRGQGKGGNAGNGNRAVFIPGSPSLYATAGQKGGGAFRTTVPVRLEVSECWGGAGGGGGSGGAENGDQSGVRWIGTGPGGGAGIDPGSSGLGYSGYPGQNGTEETGGNAGAGNPGAGIVKSGDGGDPGEAGQNGTLGGKVGGQPGAAIDGWSFVELGQWDAENFEWIEGETETEDIRGPKIN